MTAITHRENNTLALAGQAMQLFDFGNMLVKSGMLPSSVRSPEAAVAIMVKGMELGLPAMAALNGITVIQGKPTVSPQLMLSLIRRSGQAKNIEIATGKDGATVRMVRVNGDTFTATFGPAEAQAMGLNTKDNYKKQPAVMYQWRAVAACARVVFPDVVDGLYTPEELGADVKVDEDGAMTVTVQQEEKADDGMDARMKHYGPKLASRREAIKKYGVKDAEVAQFLADLPDWRASDENAEHALEKLTAWGMGLKAAQTPEPDVVDAELTPEKISAGQRKALMAHLNRGGLPDDSATRSAFYRWMVATLPAGTSTNDLPADAAQGLIDTLSGMDTDALTQTIGEFLKERAA